MFLLISTFLFILLLLYALQVSDFSGINDDPLINIVLPLLIVFFAFLPFIIEKHGIFGHLSEQQEESYSKKAEREGDLYKKINQVSQQLEERIEKLENKQKIDDKEVKEIAKNAVDEKIDSQLDDELVDRVGRSVAEKSNHYKIKQDLRKILN